MQLPQLRKGLSRAGTILPPMEWRLMHLLLAGETAPAAEMLDGLDDAAAARFRDTIRHYGLCNWVLDKLPQSNKISEEYARSFSKGALRELAACAQRRAALMRIDQLAEAAGSPAVVIKGAANAQVFYARETLRPSHDIDVYFALDTNASSTRERHLPREFVGGYPVEFHQFFITAERWGVYEDLLEHSHPLPGFNNLHAPCAMVAFTLALLHFCWHVGLFTFDLLDAVEIARAEGFDLDAAQEFWREHDLVDGVLPGLAVLATIVSWIDQGRLDALRSELGLRKRVDFSISQRLLVTPLPCGRRLRGDWFRTRLTRQSLLGYQWECFLGTREATQALTGREEFHRSFWWLHHLYLPARRVFRYWK